VSDKKIPKEILKLTFEEALTELELIVRELEAGDSNLDDSVLRYERGALLKSHCEAKLAEARMRVEKISSVDGNLVLEELDQA